MNYREHFNRKNIAVAALVMVIMATGFIAEGIGSDGPGIYRQSMPTSGSGGVVSPDLAKTSETAESSRKKTLNYWLDIEVPDVREAQVTTENLANDFGGYVTSSHFNRENGGSGSITLEIPRSNTSEFLEKLERWEITSRNRDTGDVTERYTELELELENRRKELEKLEEMMNQTKDVDSLIKIQERMSEVRSRIQYLEDRLERLDREVDYTTVTLSFEEPQPFTTEFELRESFRSAYQAVFKSLEYLIVGIGYLFPLLLIGVGVYLWRISRERF